MVSDLPQRKNEIQSRPHVVFVINVDWFFLSHRLPIALAALDAGCDVTVVAADTGESHRIRSAGLNFFPFPFSRSGTGLWHEIRTLRALKKAYKKLRPDILHHVTIKPVLYGSIAARRLGRIPVVNAISGLGYTFTAKDRAHGLRLITKALYRFAIGHSPSKVIFQNMDDVEIFRRQGIIDEDQIALIRGSGVDCNVFRPRPEPLGMPLVVLASRMLSDKGVYEYIEAVRLLRARNVRARFALVGGSDQGNPTAIPVQQLEAWQSEGIVEWWGHREDIPEVFAQSSIVVLPSYREGLPKVLIDAAASGRPIVTTDAPGCREVVRDGVNGFLVPTKSVTELADAIEKLHCNAELRKKFGEQGRRIAVSEFSVEMVVDKTLAIYDELLKTNLTRVPRLAARE